MSFKKILLISSIVFVSLNAYAQTEDLCDSKSITYIIKSSDDLNVKIVKALKEKGISDPGLVTNIYYQNMRIKENLNSDDYSTQNCLADYAYINKYTENNKNILEKIQNIKTTNSPTKCYGKTACELYKTTLIAEDDESNLSYLTKNYDDFLVLNTLSQMLYQSNQNKITTQSDNVDYRKLEVLVNELININDNLLKSFDSAEKRVPESFIYKNKNNCQIAINYFTHLQKIISELKDKISKEDVKKLGYINNVLMYNKVKAKILSIAVNEVKELNECSDIECKKANLKKAEKIGNSYITFDDLNNLFKNKTNSINKLRELNKN